MNITESSGKYTQLDSMSLDEIIFAINQEDQTVAHSVSKALPQVSALATAILEKLEMGGRLFYIGAGTSGRLGVVDASECPPTYGVPFDMVIGIIAGGDSAIRKAVENAEDDTERAIIDLDAYGINEKDVVVGIAASGRTPYVIGGLKACNQRGITTGCVVCNPDSEVSKQAKYPVEVIVGPEIVTGSTRMKAGTAQKLVLNMLTTSVMIKLGRVKGNKMVDMQMTNEKLRHRAVQMVYEATHADTVAIEAALKKTGSVRNAIDFLTKTST